AGTGFLAAVVVTDAGSRDGTGEIAEVAGCRFMTPAQPLGARLKIAAASTRSPWLMFLRAGAIPQAGWIEVAERFIKKTDMLKGAECAAVFRPPAPSDYLRPSLAEIARLLPAALRGCPNAQQTLPITRPFYHSILA